MGGHSETQLHLMTSAKYDLTYSIKPDSVFALDKEMGEETNKSVQDSKPDAAADEYPAAWQLVLITVALCCAVFCMALVGLLEPTGRTNSIDSFANITSECRTTPSSQLPSHE